MQALHLIIYTNTSNISTLISGMSSWFIWRSTYLSRLGSWRLRLQVPVDWTKTFMFGRDISTFWKSGRFEICLEYERL